MARVDPLLPNAAIVARHWQEGDDRVGLGGVDAADAAHVDGEGLGFGGHRNPVTAALEGRGVYAETPLLGKRPVVRTFDGNQTGR